MELKQQEVKFGGGDYKGNLGVFGIGGNGNTSWGSRRTAEDILVVLVEVIVIVQLIQVPAVHHLFQDTMAAMQ